MFSLPLERGSERSRGIMVVALSGRNELDPNYSRLANIQVGTPSSPGCLTLGITTPPPEAHTPPPAQVIICYRLTTQTNLFKQIQT